MNITERMNRREFLFYFLFDVVIAGVSYLFGGASTNAELLKHPIGLFLDLIGITLFVYAAVRRLHDTDHSGWWVLLNFIPIGNIALLIYLLFAEGSYGLNKYDTKNV